MRTVVLVGHGWSRFTLFDLLFMIVRGRGRRGGAAARAAHGNPLCMRIVMGDGVKVKAVRRLQKYDAYTMWVYI